MIEKPSKDQVLSLYSILGRCILPPEIFEVLENTKPGRGDEIQLTDAMCVIAQSTGFMAVDFIGKRYDMGDKLGIMKASVETALTHPEIGESFRGYLKKVCMNL
jgi:UTP--glucose-1-phosphate uridylyltransferase